MKAGKNTLIISSNTTISESATAESNRGAVNLLDPNSLIIWEIEGASETATFVFTSSIAPDAVALFNIDVDTSVQLDVYSAYPGTISDTITTTVANLAGLDSKNVYLPVTAASIDAIKITVTGTGSSSMSSAGWLWAGELIDFECAEAIQPFDIVNDSATVTRANTIDVNPSYDYQEYSITLRKDTGFEELRTKVRALLAEGYATPRPYLIDEPIFDAPEVLLGILDSGKVGYDTFYMKDTDSTFKAQITIGLREIRGLVNVS